MMKHSKLTRSLAAILASLMLTGAVACTPSQTPEETSGSNETSAVTQAPVEDAKGETTADMNFIVIRCILIAIWI